jgi:hypothetical protein
LFTLSGACGAPENDAAFLRGLYQMNPAGTLGMQKNQIAYQMERDLKGH